MVPPMAANPPSANQTACTNPASLLATSATKNSVTQDFNLMFHAFFPIPLALVKFHLITAMTTLFQTILKDKLSLVLQTPSNDNQIFLALAPVPKGEAEFKTYFKVSMTHIECKNQMQVCIGCQTSKMTTHQPPPPATWTSTVTTVGLPS